LSCNGTGKRPISKDEIRQSFVGAGAEKFPPILTPVQLAALAQVSVKTIYLCFSQGRLDRAFRRRGKHDLIWRDRAVDILFNGPEWTS
jgi:hypothetical protein